MMEGVLGDVGDLRESAVLLRFNSNSSSFSETELRRGDRRREGMDDMLDASLMSVAARVEMSVSVSDSVPEVEASLAEDADDGGRSGRLSGDVTSGNAEEIGARVSGRTGREFCICPLDTSRLSVRYTRVKGNSRDQRTLIIAMKTDFSPLINILGDCLLRFVGGSFSLHSCVSGAFPTCRLRSRGSFPGTTSGSSWPE